MQQLQLIKDNRNFVVEAMKQVTMIRQQKYRISILLNEEVLELLIPLRLNIEIYALKKGFALWDERVIKEFEMIIKEMVKAVKFQDLPQLVELDLRFHEIIIHSAKKTNVINIWKVSSTASEFILFFKRRFTQTSTKLLKNIKLC